MNVDADASGLLC